MNSPRRFQSLLAGAIALVSALSLQIAPIAQADNPPRKIFSGWLPYYSMKTSLPDVVSNSDLIQEVNPFWYTLKSATKITDLYTPANPSVPMSVPLQTLQSMKFSIIPTVTDGTDKGVLAGLIANAATRAQVVATITTLVMSNNFDGIDLDFENFAFVDGTASWASTMPNWIQFISDLSASLHANGKLLSVTTPVLFDPATGKKGYYVYAWAAIARSIDRLKIMTYDYSTSSPGPIGPITWAESAVQYAVSVVPASEVYVGIAGYGRDWITAVSGTCPVDVAAAITPQAKAATFVMRDAATLAANYGVLPTYTPKFAETTFTYQKVYNGVTSLGQATSCTATRTAWYQDAQGYSVRAGLVAKYRLGGVAAWTIGMEDPTAISAIRDVAKSIAPDTILSSVTAGPNSALIGDAISVTGSFTLPDTKPVAGLAAKLEIKNSLGDWRTIFTGVTAADGSLSTSLVFGEITSVRMSSDGSWDRLASQSPVTDVAIKPLISWSPPSSIRSGNAYLITGEIQPKIAGITVNLEGAESSPAVTDENGLFAVILHIDTPGLVKLRLATVATQKLAAASGPYFTVLVR
jgi:spore germination protein YaaH